MAKKCVVCYSCGTPLRKPEDHALGLEESEFCTNCTHPDGTRKSYQELLNDLAVYFIQSKTIHPKGARDLARQTMQKLPYWRLRRK